jgi:DNA-directed RNA polymerase subunit M/transcription elongation factor TFIIS
MVINDSVFVTKAQISSLFASEFHCGHCGTKKITFWTGFASVAAVGSVAIVV